MLSSSMCTLDEGESVGGMPTIMVHPLLKAKDVARVLGVGERTVWRMASRAAAGFGEFPGPIQIGRHVVRWRWQDIEKFLSESAGK